MNITIRNSEPKDLNILEKIENFTFPKFQQSSKRSLHLSLNSPFQKVWLAEYKKGRKLHTVGALILHSHKRALRIFSIGVLPDYQGLGIGLRLLNHACNYALANGYSIITLEASASDLKLIAWYEKSGFIKGELLKDYYCEGEDAVRMAFEVPGIGTKNTISNILVVDSRKKWTIDIEGVEVVSSKKYLASNEFHQHKNIRVFNLCKSYRYQSMGYYVSLMASARDQRVIPSVTTIRDFKDLNLIRSIANDIDELIQTSLQKIEQKAHILNIYFGHTVEKDYKYLGRKLYMLFEVPLLQVEFKKTDKWLISKALPLSFKKVRPEDLEQVQVSVVIESGLVEELSAIV